MLEGASASVATQAAHQGAISVAVKALDSAKVEGEAAVGLIDQAGQVAASQPTAGPTAPSLDGSGRLVNIVT